MSEGAAFGDALATIGRAKRVSELRKRSGRDSNPPNRPEGCLADADPELAGRIARDSCDSTWVSAERAPMIARRLEKLGMACSLS